MVRVVDKPGSEVKPPADNKLPATVKVAAWSAQHRWLVFGLWFLFTIGLFGISLGLGGIKTQSATDSRPGASAKLEAIKGWDTFEANNVASAGEQFLLVISHPSLKVTDPAYHQVISDMYKQLATLTITQDGKVLPVLNEFADPYTLPAQAGLFSPDLSSVRFVGTVEGDSALVKQKLAPVKTLLANFQATYKDFKIVPYSSTLGNDEVSELISRDLDSSLIITIPLTFAILLLAFGAVVASIVPLVMAVAALLGAFGLLGIYSQAVTPVSSYATQVVVLIGLAVAVDYSLFMITRFRTERRHGHTKLEAIKTSSSTSGRAVFFSGLTVAISLAGLFFLDDPIFRSMAIGTIGVVLISLIGSLTFLPAILAILGNGVNWGRIPYFGRDRAEGSGFWGAMVRQVMRFPVVFLVVAAVLMLALAYPVTQLKLGETDLSSFPAKLQVVQAFNLLNEKWPQGTELKLEAIVTQADRADTKASIEKFEIAASQVKGLSQPKVTYSTNGKVADVALVMSGQQNDTANHDLVKKIRQEVVPANFGNLAGVQVFVTGMAAYSMDSTKIYTDAMPLVFAFVLSLSFILLLVAFHSIVIPVTAIAMNLLSTGASYGVLVLVFQLGFLKDQLGVTPGDVQNWVPVFIFTILFGLSMDYHLFLLTRIKEARDRGLSSNEAVAKGIRITSGTITSAAIIMVMVFSVFVTLQIVFIRQLGLGLAVAVLLDATIVRSLLVPATMRLLGDWNWFMPKFLGWIPRVTIEGASGEPEETEVEEVLLKV
ncbi:MAG: MMPL family transporter [Chloroflexi bacterium]|nr:MMPL family transporter [Chloroflexota bacterium]OJV95936.1 MAG: hypothetical protein BGO39_03630 [Chloroflexi bacterium 54-19]